MSVKKQGTKRCINSLLLRRSREILATKENLIGLIYACLIYVSSVSVFLILFNILAYAIGFLVFDPILYNQVINIVLAGVSELAFWLTGPLLLGVYRVASCAIVQKDFSLSRLFIFFSSPRLLLRAWRILVGSFLRLLVLSASLLSFFFVFGMPWNPVETWGLIGVGVGLLLLWAFLTVVCYPVLSLAVSDFSIPILEARQKGRKMTKKHRAALVKHCGALLLLFAASLLSIGIVTLFYVLPMIFVSRVAILELLSHDICYAEEE